MYWQKTSHCIAAHFVLFTFIYSTLYLIIHAPLLTIPPANVGHIQGKPSDAPAKKSSIASEVCVYYASPKWSWWNLLMWQCASLFLQWLSRKTTSHIWPQSQLVHRKGSMSVTLEFGQSSYVPSQLLRQCKASQDGGWANCGCFILCSRKLGFTWIYCRNFRKGRGQDGQVHKRIG